MEHGSLGDSLLRLYRAGKLTPKIVKESLAEASAEMDARRDADVLRALCRRLRYIEKIPNDERFLKEFWRAMREWNWHEDGSGI